MCSKTFYAILIGPMINFGIQLVMIDRWLALNLGLSIADLEPYSLTIATSIEDTHRVIGYTKQPLQLIFVLVISYFTYIYIYSVQSLILPTMTFWLAYKHFTLLFWFG